MRALSYLNVLLILLIMHPVSAQVQFDFSDEAVQNRLIEDVYTLASDEMEGREAGTGGEQKAAAYIKMRMQEIGLQPMFGESFYQEFPFPGDWLWGEDNTLAIGDNVFVHGEDYHVLPGSASGFFSLPFVDVGFGLTGLEVDGFEDYCDYTGLEDIEGKLFLMEFYVPEELDTLADRRIFQLLFQKVRTAQEKGAAGIVFVNSKSERDDPPVDLRMSRSGFEMPVLFAHEEVHRTMLENPREELSMEVNIYREELTAINVAGYIDNQAERTVVIGAHYDHIGYGGRGSRSPGERAIHPGADDNASGTAGILEAARYISHSTLDQHNYIFIAFSAEEKGLIGSRYFTDSDAYNMEQINYMFNLDMIGRLEDNNLTIIGTGTSPQWDELIDQHAPEHLVIRKSPGGRGGSDHTSFYLKDIPVLFFFTGVHEDYHRPGDTADKVNFEGAHEITYFALDMVRSLDAMDRLAFTRSSAPAAERPQRRTVALGLMPDHAFDGEGMRVLSVTDDQPAFNAGMQNGDVIIRINDMPVAEIYTYMEALGSLSGGDLVTVVVKRGEEEHTLEVQL